MADWAVVTSWVAGLVAGLIFTWLLLRDSDKAAAERMSEEADKRD